MKRALLIFAALLLGAASLSAQIPATPGWYEVPNTHLRSVCPPNFFGGDMFNFHDRCNGVIDAWNSAVMDTTRNRLIIWGGGHQDYGGNEVYAFDFNSLQLTRLNDPTIPTNYYTAACLPAMASDSTKPNGRHIYDGMAYMPNVDKMLVQGGSVTCTAGGATNDTWVLDLATMTWERKTPAGTVPGVTPGIVSAYDSVSGKVYVHDDKDLYTYTYATNTYVKLTSGADFIDYHDTAVIDPVRRKMVVIGNGEAWVWDISQSNPSKTALSTTGGGTIISSTYPGLAYDPVSNRIVGWNGYADGNFNTIYSLNLDTNVWTPTTITGGTTVNSGIDSICKCAFKRWNYSPASGVFVLVNSVDQNVFTLRLSTISVQLTSTATGTLPYTVGMGFKKGDLTGTPITSDTNSQVIVKRTWNDGSVKHAIISGTAAFTAGTPHSLTILNGTPPGGTALTCADITTANPSASIQFGSIGTVTLSSLFATPFRTWLSGPQMVECHYTAAVGADPLLRAWFYVRLYANGRVWVRMIGENGYIDGTETDKSYVPTVQINGSTVYNNGGSALAHGHNTRWTVEGWIGTNPGITMNPNPSYLMSTKLVPNYWKTNPSSSALNALAQTYSPMSLSDFEPFMGSAGFNPDIGILPAWDALCVTSGDSRACNSSLAHASSYNAYPYFYRDSSTKGIPKISDWLHASIHGGTYSTFNTAFTVGWEFNHAPSEAYLAYLISGDYWHYETLLMNAAIDYLALGDGKGVGFGRVLTGETRGTGWALRTLSQLAGIYPSADAIGAEYQTLLSNNMTSWKSVRDAGGIGLGYLWNYEAAVRGYGTIGEMAPWMEHFAIQSVGAGSDLEPLADMTNYNIVRDTLYKGVVGITGISPGGYCFTRAANQQGIISTVDSGNPIDWFQTWDQMYQATVAANVGIPVESCGNTLLGDSGAAPGTATQGYWGNYLPAMSYATEHQATGAAAAWARLTGASNWSAIETAGFDDLPIWGIVPRNIVPSGPDTTPPIISSVSSSGITTSAATITWSTNEVADSQVEYGLTTSYGSTTTLDTSLVVSHSAGLTGLASNTLYHYRVTSKDAASNSTTSSDNTFTTANNSPPPDTTPPVISAVSASGISTSGATITWTTDEAADSQVEYGTTTGYGSSTTLDTSLVLSHSQILSGLMANTLYHYRVKSKDAAANLATGADNTFTSTAPAGGGGTHRTSRTSSSGRTATR